MFGVAVTKKVFTFKRVGFRLTVCLFTNRVFRPTNVRCLFFLPVHGSIECKYVPKPFHTSFKPSNNAPTITSYASIN